MSSTSESTPVAKRPAKGKRFTLIFLALIVSAFLSALDIASVSTALPVIVQDLHGDDFSWVGSAYLLAATAFLPMSGGIAEIFGRRPAFMFTLGTFVLGSALCGAAQTMQWLIAARVVQGLGSGGILSLSSIIISDLVTLQERGAYNGFFGLSWAFATAIGPLVGGSLANQGQWRWLFYLNLPIGGLAILMVVLFLTLPTPQGSLRSKLQRMDWIGNFLIISSTAAVVIALTWGGTKYPWSSVRVLVPLILGCIGLVTFIVYEVSFAKHPMVPAAIISNRSTLSGYTQTFIASIGLLMVTYYLPVYYQACHDASVMHSGVDMLGLSLTLGPAITLCGVSVTVTKRYRPQLWIGWVLLILGVGTYIRMDASTPMSQAIGLPILMGAGIGILAAATYFPVLAPLPVTENAHALAFFTFCRSFAGVWGVSIGATVLQNQLKKHLSPSLLVSLPNSGGEVDLLYSLIPKIRFLEEPTKTQVQDAFGESLSIVWAVMTGILGIGALASLFMRDIPLQNVIDEKWALETKSRDEIPLSNPLKSPS